MGADTKQLRIRIKSVDSSLHLTKAMGLVASSKIRKANDDRKITVSVDGPVTLQGFGSARPCMSEDFISDTHTTYRGHALAVVRAGYEKGEAVISG